MVNKFFGLFGGEPRTGLRHALMQKKNPFFHRVCITIIHSFIHSLYLLSFVSQLTGLPLHSSLPTEPVRRRGSPFSTEPVVPQIYGDPILKIQDARNVLRFIGHGFLFIRRTVSAAHTQATSSPMRMGKMHEGGETDIFPATSTGIEIL